MENKQFFGGSHHQMPQNFNHPFPALEKYGHAHEYIQSVEYPGFPVNQETYYSQSPQMAEDPSVMYPAMSPETQYQMNQNIQYQQFYAMAQEQFYGCSHQLPIVPQPEMEPSENHWKTEMIPPMPERVSHPEMQHSVPQVWLKDEQTWRKFDNVKGGNEMLVRINGRDLFPRLEFIVQCLDATGSYKIGIKLMRINDYFMKYAQHSGWHVSSETADVVPMESNEVFNGILTGKKLMEEGINFNDTKIYNVPKERKDEKAAGTAPPAKRRRTEVDAENWLQVHTQCIYMPVLSIYEVLDGRKGFTTVKLAEYSFDCTQFHVVTKYKSEEINKLKIQENKHVSKKTRDLEKKKQSGNISSDSDTLSISSRPS